jgi:hypothetical protein
VLESSQLESLTSYLLADLDTKAQKEWDEQGWLARSLETIGTYETVFFFTLL